MARKPRPCRKCGSYDRYPSGSCKPCTITRVNAFRAKGGASHDKNRTHYARHVIKEKPIERSIHDPTLGAAFPAGLARCMAGR